MLDALLRTHWPRLPHRHHRSARRRQEHAGHAARSGVPRARRDRRRSWRSIPPARSAAARCSAIACAWASSAGDDGVFIRSMATRGSLGGLAVHTAQVCDVLDAAGFTRVLIETVGVGQSELEVAETADSTAVVLVPESGDADAGDEGRARWRSAICSSSTRPIARAQNAARFAIRSAARAARTHRAIGPLAGAAHCGVARRSVSPKLVERIEEASRVAAAARWTGASPAPASRAAAARPGRRSPVARVPWTVDAEEWNRQRRRSGRAPGHAASGGAEAERRRPGASGAG